MDNECIYLGICKKECPNICVQRSEMNYLLKTSNIPKSQQRMHRLKPDECDLPAFEKLAEIQSNIVEFTEHGDLLYIYSEICGNGKTTWTIKLMLQYFNEIWEGNCLEPRGVFINVPTFINKSKAVISNPDPAFDDLRALIPRVDLVVFDDVTVSRLSDYDYSLLLSLIDERIFQNKAMIFTGNIYPDVLHEVLGQRLASRICQGINIELKGVDMRKWSSSNS